jgi:hypothetical protein
MRTLSSWNRNQLPDYLSAAWNSGGFAGLDDACHPDGYTSGVLAWYAWDGRVGVWGLTSSLKFSVQQICRCKSMISFIEIRIHLHLSYSLLTILPPAIVLYVLWMAASTYVPLEIYRVAVSG